MPKGVVPIGSLRESVNVQRRAPQDDGAGNSIGDWTDFILRKPARIQARRGGEQVIAARLEGVQVYDVWLRVDAETREINAGDRIVDARDPGRVFAVRYAGNLDERGRFILLQCELGVAA